MGRLRARRRRHRDDPPVSRSPARAADPTCARTSPTRWPPRSRPKVAGAPVRDASRVPARRHRRRQAGTSMSERRRTACSSRRHAIARSRLGMAALVGRRDRVAGPAVHPPLACPLRSIDRDPVPVLRDDARRRRPQCTAISARRSRSIPAASSSCSSARLLLVRPQLARTHPATDLVAHRDRRRALDVEHRLQPDVPPTPAALAPSTRSADLAAAFEARGRASPRRRTRDHRRPGDRSRSA